MSAKPRIPGSQVPPGLKPFIRSPPPASTHARVPLQPTEGSTYRVRDKDWVAVWGTNLSHADAVKLKEHVVTTRRSKTARVEDEAVPPPAWYQAAHPRDDGDAYSSLEITPTPATAEPSPEAPTHRTLFSLDDGSAEIRVPSAGAVVSVPAGHELVVNGVARPVPTAVEAGDTVEARPVDPVIIAARAQALQAAARAIPARPRPAYRDRTVQPLVPRTGPVPKDKTAQAQVHVRLTVAPAAAPKPLPSPSKVAEIPDGAPLEEGALGDDDIHDLAVDIGGGPSEADIEHARRMRDAERAG